jgi:23S rRNA pseudouridine1911/1915/1917 synthase
VKVEIAAADRVEVAHRRPQHVDRSSAAAAAFVRRHLPFAIIHEDADVLVVDKPSGLLTSTVPGERRPTLLAIVRAHVEVSAPPRGRPPRVGLIHRLDRDASGLLVFSKTHESYLSLKRQFFEHSLERTYTAVVRGAPTPPAGRVQSRLVERADGTVYSARRPGEGERAVTDYEVVERGKGHSLVRVTLHTGRKHQIRVHLSERGAPIVGDTMYGQAAQRPRGKERPAEERLMLAATRLSFTHPRTGERLTFERAAPPEFAAALAGPAATSR